MGGAWVENQPHWFVIDRRGTLTFMLEPRFDTPTAYEKDVDLVLEALRKAARQERVQRRDAELDKVDE